MPDNRTISPSRRALLGGIAAGAGAFALSPGHAQNSKADVVIVGAGAAGIAAAIALKQANINYIVIEAENRIGGRALTDTKTFHAKDKTPVPFDIGCAWIHAYHPGDPFADWSKKYNFDTQPHDLEVTELYYGRTPYSSAMVGLQHTDEERAHCVLEKAFNAGEDVPAGTLVKDKSRPMDAAATYMGPMDMAVDFDGMSNADFAAMADYDPNYLVREGYGTLVRKVGLEAQLNIVTGTPVTSIDTTGTGVQVQMSGLHTGTIQAKAVIVTTSMGVLHSKNESGSRIKFVGGLPPGVQDDIDTIEMGLLAKIPLQISGVSHYLSGIKPYDNALQMFANKGDIYFLAWPWDSDLMVGFVGGKFAWDLCRAGEKAAISFAKGRLDDLFGSGMSRKVGPALLTPWATNTYALGAYSAATPGNHANRQKLAAQNGGKLYFAGEALAPCGMFATCSGAYMSGTNVAWDVVKSLTGQSAPEGARYDDCVKVEPPKPSVGKDCEAGK